MTTPLMRHALTFLFAVLLAPMSALFGADESKFAAPMREKFSACKARGGDVSEQMRRVAWGYPRPNPSTLLEAQLAREQRRHPRTPVETHLSDPQERR